MAQYTAQLALMPNTVEAGVAAVDILQGRVVPVAVHYTEQVVEAAAHGQTPLLVDVVEHGVVMPLAAEVPLLRLMPEEMVMTMPLAVVMGAAVVPTIP